MRFHLRDTSLNTRSSIVAVPVVHCLELTAVDGNDRLAKQIQAATQLNELAAYAANRFAVVLSKVRNERGNIVLPDDKATVNIMGNVELNDRASLFGEFKYVTQETGTDIRPSSFWDLLFGAADNPCIPDFLQGVANAAGGIAITVDPIFFDARSRTERDTLRFVGGIEGEFSNGWNHECSVNYGRYREETNRTGQVIVDRFFAAIDAVKDPATGLPACRAEVDPNAPAMNTPFEIPAYQAGYFSYTPGSGDCVPLNIWAGQPGVSPAAAAWVTTPEWSDFAIEQFVFAAMAASSFSTCSLIFINAPRSSSPPTWPSVNGQRSLAARK